MINLKNSRDIEVLKEGGKILAGILKQVAGEAREGMSTLALDKLAEELISKAGGKPAFKGYQPRGAKEPYPFTLCASLNNVLVHGLPRANVILKKGDIIGLDLGMQYKGLFTDMAVTVGIEPISIEVKKLLEATNAALEKSINIIKPGITTGDIGFVIENTVMSYGFSVVRDLVGHGVGFSVHEEPPVPNFGKPGTGETLKSGMVLAVEPMVSMGSPKVKLSRDGWSYETQDNSLSAHFEHTVVVTENGCEVLTR